MKCKMVATLRSTLKSNLRVECLFPFSDGYLEIFFSGTYLPDELLKSRLIPTPISSTPTSNGDLIHLRKMSHCGHVPVFLHNHFGPGS